MKTIGNDIHIQRGETWTLDFDLTTTSGHPFMLYKYWTNPYLAITVAAGLYEQKGDFRRTYWLDLDTVDVEQADGSIAEEQFKRFIITEPLWVGTFSVDEVLALYADDGIVADPTSDNDITNYLFYTDIAGVRAYKYLKSYTVDIDGDGDIDQDDENWVDYNFHIVQPFETKDWMEQRYLFDMKILTGEKIEEYIAREADKTLTDDTTDIEIEQWLDEIQDDTVRDEVRAAYDVGMPLAPTFDTKMLILEPTNLYVSVNIQGGIR